MQKEQMKKLLFSFLPEIHEKNLIHEFPAGEDSMAIGISLENIDEERNVFVYNIFCGDEYININGYGTTPFIFLCKDFLNISNWF